MTPAARVPAIFGAATFGSAERFSKISDPAVAQKHIDLLVSQGHTSIDAARSYGAGTTEQIISKLDLKGVSVDTKFDLG